MAKKQWTDEERKAFGAKMKAARQNKNLKKENSTKQFMNGEKHVDQPDFSGTPAQTIGSSELEELRKQIQELKDMQWQTLVAQAKEGQNVTVSNGALTGTFEKYTLSPDIYPSPVERLMDEARLARFAFPLNYELNYEVGVSEYETIDHIRTREPKFSLELIRIVMDEETGEPTNGRYIICRLIMHEDPEAAMVIARENGLEVEEDSEEKFLNEMRYIRMRDWLLECFYPSPVKKVSNRKEVVINGQLVSYYEVNDENNAVIDFTKLPKIKF